MIDPVAAGVQAILRHDLSRLPIVFAAGALSSVGPCVAPRYVALTALAGSGRARIRPIAAFIAGVLAAYATLGYGLGVLGALFAHAGVLDAALSCVLCGAGLVLILREPHRHAVRCSARTSAAFALGAASAMVISPCCTPVIAAVAALATTGREPLAGAAILASFALGHCSPLALVGCGGSFVSARLERLCADAAPRTVAGALLLGLGGYYAVLV